MGEDVVEVEALAACADAVSRAAAGRAGRDRGGDAAASMAVAGTATTVAAIQHGRYDPEAVHGARITREQVRMQERRLAAMTLAERRGVPGTAARSRAGDRGRAGRAGHRARPFRSRRGNRLRTRQPARQRAAGRPRHPARLTARAPTGRRARRGVPGAGLEPACPGGQPGLSRLCLTSSTTRAAPSLT